MTNFNTQIKNDWVFGFERPRLNVNEAYLRVENDPSDTFPVDPNDGKKKAQLPYDMKMWLEIHNPITPASQAEQFSSAEGYPDPAAPDDMTHGGYRAALKDTVGGSEKSVYRVLIYKVNQAANPAGVRDPMGMRTVDNVAGLPTTPGITIIGNPLTFDKNRQPGRGRRFRRNDRPAQTSRRNIATRASISSARNWTSRTAWAKPRSRRPIRRCKRT